MNNTVTLAVLASGRGSNLQSIIDHCEAGKIDAEVAVVLSDNPDAQALERAENHDIPSRCMSPDDHPNSRAYEKSMIECLDRYQVELVVMAGFMQVLTKYFVDYYANQIINIHPSLLPAFKGKNAQKQALDYGVKVSGCTVHFVDEKIDHGPIILQKSVSVKDDDTEESLSQRILKQEHQILPRAIQLYKEDRLEISGRTVHIREP